jgi:hypothetical protein
MSIPARKRVKHTRQNLVRHSAIVQRGQSRRATAFLRGSTRPHLTGSRHDHGIPSGHPSIPLPSDSYSPPRSEEPSLSAIVQHDDIPSPPRSEEFSLSAIEKHDDIPLNSLEEMSLGGSEDLNVSYLHPEEVSPGLYEDPDDLDQMQIDLAELDESDRHKKYNDNHTTSNSAGIIRTPPIERTIDAPRPPDVIYNKTWIGCIIILLIAVLHTKYHASFRACTLILAVLNLVFMSLEVIDDPIIMPTTLDFSQAS